MSFGIMQPPGSPFPPTDVTAVAIIDIGLMFAHIIILIVLMVLLLHCYRKFMVFPVELVIYGFSLILGLESLEHPHTPFSPSFEIFFLLFQTVLFLLIVIGTFNPKHEG